MKISLAHDLKIQCVRFNLSIVLAPIIELEQGLNFWTPLSANNSEA